MTIIPILLYHSISADPARWISTYSVPPDAFARHTELIAASGRTPLTVSELVDALNGPTVLPPRPVVITFDDGFADFAAAAVQLTDRGIRSTLYVTTGALRGAGPWRAKTALPAAEMLTWEQVKELADMDVEIGTHTNTHPQLDTVPIARARAEIREPKRALEDYLGREVRSFAYPHGFQSARLRSEVQSAGYASACGVMNALSSESDRHFVLARLTVRRTTTDDEIAGWLLGRGARVAPYPEALRTKAWRAYRRGRGTRFTQGVIDTRSAKVAAQQ
jgi:peptidoglycan/xylan/chitin deacetylase (PgdA/CDA1 family)